jgi:hypothetical protein
LPDPIYKDVAFTRPIWYVGSIQFYYIYPGLSLLSDLSIHRTNRLTLYIPADLTYVWLFRSLSFSLFCFAATSLVMMTKPKKQKKPNAHTHNNIQHTQYNTQRTHTHTTTFYKVNTDFTNADVRGASFEDTSMDGASLKNTNAAGSYFGNSILDVATLENADFTDAQFPAKVLALLCERSDMVGTHPSTGVSTRDSAMCP